MIISTIKSKAQEKIMYVQTINPRKRVKTISSYSNSFPILKTSSGVNSFKKVSQFLTVALAMLFIVSCQKEELANPILSTTNGNEAAATASTNTAPVVNAGPVSIVVYSTSKSNGATLYGKATDNQGPVTVKWTQTRGNSKATIAHPNSDTTVVSDLVPGVYTFVLTATDKTGISRKDSTSISVLQKVTWTIEGVTREALVHPSTGGSGKAPIIFAFHGHNGSDLGFAKRGFELTWPEAIVVYPQGLPTPAGSDKNGSDPGWQATVGEINIHTHVKDQDVKFFNAMVTTLTNSFNANPNHVFAHGWSNGGEFVYNVLWAAVGTKLQAISPAACTNKTTNGKVTIPTIHIAGTADPDVKFNSQQSTVNAVRSLDKCSSSGTTWATGNKGLLGTKYASSINKNVVLLQYNGGHAYPFTVPPFIDQFFKQTMGL